MSSVADIEAAVRRLPPDQFAAFRTWVEEYAADLWDERIARDAAAGRLDHLIAEARADIAAGRTRPL